MNESLQGLAATADDRIERILRELQALRQHIESQSISYSKFQEGQQRLRTLDELETRVASLEHSLKQLQASIRNQGFSQRRLLGPAEVEREASHGNLSGFEPRAGPVRLRLPAWLLWALLGLAGLLAADIALRFVKSPIVQYDFGSIARGTRR